MRLTHPIFNQPLRPVIEIVKRNPPANYLSWPGGDALPVQLDCWTVQVGKLTAEIDFGLVSTPFGFEDSPDAELISSGINSKGPTSVALGRHANLFLWGFAGDPTQMTPSARQVFVNTIVYMARFDGQRPLAPKESKGREWAIVYLSFAPHWKDGVVPDYVKQMFAPALWKQAESEVKNLPADAGMNIEPGLLVSGKLRDLLRANLEYLRHDGKAFVMDGDAKALGKSTRSPALLDAIAARLATAADDPPARRLLARYLPDHEHDDAAQASSLARNSADAY
jgi:hypothetical protein